MICREKDRGRCSNENMEVGSECISKDRKTKTDMLFKRHEGGKSTGSRSTIS